ncbi:MAG: tRNA epoxyqueuosine(34) reductase QueG [Thermoflexales bacterium]
MIAASGLRKSALEHGFDLIGIAPAGPTPGAARFWAWLAAGYAGEMGYLAREPERRADPRLAFEGARWLLLAGVSYDSLAVPIATLTDPARGRIARYAWGDDYHDVLTPRLRELGESIGGRSRAYVDTGPVLERAWAERAGLGFIGKNTCLIHRTRGSYFFLGAILIADEISQDEVPEPGPRKALAGCGACRRCLDACPTQAFPAPGVLDARRCISYLTIELKGAIPVELRPRMGNWIFGCDVCQDVCPYVRRYSAATPLREFHPIDADRAAPRLLDALAWDREAFNQRFRGSALKRAKWRGVMRNVCVAAGNWGDPNCLPLLERHARGDDALVAEHAAWAIARIAQP